MSAVELEAFEHRMRDSFAGYVWGDPVRLWAEVREEMLAAFAAAPSKPMSGAEIVAELDWLREGAASPWEACEQLGRDGQTLARMCSRYRRADLARWLAPVFEVQKWAAEKARAA